LCAEFMATSALAVMIVAAIKRPPWSNKLIVGIALCATGFALHHVSGTREMHSRCSSPLSWSSRWCASL
jgi:glycerol uptake facilitator-like aquaporin